LLRDRTENSSLALMQRSEEGPLTAVADVRERKGPPKSPVRSLPAGALVWAKEGACGGSDHDGSRDST
jgi:hypothetical protein